MDLQGLTAQLEALKDAAAEAAAPSATAMAENFRKGVVETLRRTSHAPGMYWKAPPGEPPAYVTGNLARSVQKTPASGSPRASAFVGAYAQYAALQAFGGETWPNRGKYMHWINSGGSWFKERVYVPAHPYFPPTLSRQVADGTLSDAATEAFWARISPVFG